MALSELSDDFGLCSHPALHPGVGNRVSDRKSGRWLQLKHVGQEILELGLKKAGRLIARMLVPESVDLP